jgi:hypothetical protein
LISTEKYATNSPHENMLNEENTIYNNDENNTRGLANAVITVTPVTDENTIESMNYNRNIALPYNMYRLYEGGDTWACKNCNDKGDKWYMIKHVCRMNKK